jgi:hypothetical protein
MRWGTSAPSAGRKWAARRSNRGNPPSGMSGSTTQSTGPGGSPGSTAMTTAGTHPQTVDASTRSPGRYGMAGTSPGPVG